MHADRAIAGRNERDRTTWRHVVDEEQLVDVIDGLGDVVAVIGRLGRPFGVPGGVHEVDGDAGAGGLLRDARQDRPATAGERYEYQH